MNQNIIFKPLQMGDILIPNRLCMAALTRMRCHDDELIPNELHIEYYSQRAAAGFILTECSPVSDRSIAFPRCGGVFTQEQVQGWKKVVDKVHEKGGRIINQIWHSGRASHSTLQNGLEIWGPSPIAIRGTNLVAQKPQEVPHEMTLDEIKEVIAQFRVGAENCKKAGFDGIELHAAHGYLIDQFLRESSNQRKDNYGGSIENRSRLCLEVIDQLISVFGNGRVGIKISPVGCYNDMNDSDPLALYTYLIKELEKRKIAFIEMKDDKDKENEFEYGYPASQTQIKDLFDAFKPLFSGVMIANNQYTPETAKEGIEKGKFEAATFGRLYMSNPDLVERALKSQKLNTKVNYQFAYGGGANGYTDYPFYDEWIKEQV